MSAEEWVYLLGLLVPLALYNVTFEILRVTYLSASYGPYGLLELLRSELLFNAGYTLLWIGLFAVVRGGLLRGVLLGLLHATAMVSVVLTSVSYQYFLSTGSTLDHGILSYYLAAPAEAQGAVYGQVTLSFWLVLSAALFYVLAGPALLTGALFRSPEARRGSPELLPEDARRGAEQSGDGQRVERELSRRRFLVAGASAGLGVLLLRESFLPRAAGAEGNVSRAPIPNLIASRGGKAHMEAATDGAEVANTLAGVRLRPTARTRRRHVALIHLESVRERSVTLYDENLATTPYLAELGKRSLVVERAYTTIPHTSNAITSANSGLYPYPGGDIVEAERGGIPARCLPELLGEQGYRSAWFQSATQRFEDRPQLVENFGYDHFQPLEAMDKRGFEPVNYFGYEDDIMLEPSRRWLEKDLDTPSLIMYMGVTPHHDYQVPERYGRKNFAEDDEFDRYLNTVRYDDFWVANIIEQYKDLGIYEDTVFVLYGDHGEGFGEHGRYQHDGVIWEEGLRVPLIVHDPRRIAQGVRVRGPANLMDIPPTVVDLLGYEIAGGEYPGRSMLDLPEGRTLYFGCHPDLLSAAIVRGDGKYIHHYGNRPDELYDLSRDPLEKHNLAGELGGEDLGRLRAEILDWRAKAKAVYER